MCRINHTAIPNPRISATQSMSEKNRPGTKYCTHSMAMPYNTRNPSNIILCLCCIQTICAHVPNTKKTITCNTLSFIILTDPCGLGKHASQKVTINAISHPNISARLMLPSGIRAFIVMLPLGVQSIDYYRLNNIIIGFENPIRSSRNQYIAVDMLLNPNFSTPTVADFAAIEMFNEG